MDPEVMQDEVPYPFQMVIEELLSQESSTNSLANDAFGMVDNVLGEGSVAFPRQNLTKDTVIAELDNLEYYEKISLAFLLYDDVNYILQRLMIAESARLAGSLIQPDLLSPWIRTQRDGLWENKLLEALCIIQNYQILQKLGCNAESEKSRFLPRSPESSLFVNCMRKALYHVCESLDSDGLKKLLRYVKEDYRLFQKGVELQSFDPEYMEVNLLYWSSRGYISLGDKDGRGVDVHRLKTQLKTMGETTLVEKLESAEKATVNALGMNQPDADTVRISSLGSLTECRSQPSSMSQHSVASSCDQVDRVTEGEYPVDSNNVGYCIIINQKNFYMEPNPCLKRELPDEELTPRLGTDVDRDRLSETFNSLGFTVYIVENLTHTDLLESVNSAITKFVKQEHSCFVLCILSHGIRGAVYGTNSVPVYVDDLENLMKDCAKLMGKPKILIIQACQGQTQQDAVLSQDIATDGPAFSRVKSTDCMTFWSTVPGFASFRHEIEGTWFIQAVCQQLLCARPTDDLYKLFTAVNREVSCKRAHVNQTYKTMVPIFSTTFTRSLVLPLHPRAKVKVSQRMFERHAFNALLREYIKDRKRKAEQKIKEKLKLM
ncbi:caspase-8 isoform X2 [Cryptotermes secundus]|nr:caspase-8 isoform X2 [Cryptotermes secundus]